MGDIWSELEIKPTDSIREIKRAYAKKLKSTRPDDDSRAFQLLREAYEMALIYAERSESYNDKSSILSVDRQQSGEKQESDTHDANNHGILYTDIPDSNNTNQNIIQDETRSTAVKIAHEVIHTIESSGSESAADLLNELISSDEFINIELRQIFELNLLDNLSRLDSLPLFFLNECVGLFGWDDIDHPYRDRFHYIMWAATNSLDAIETKAFLEKLTYGSNWSRIASNIGEKAPKAAKLLLSEWSPDYFRRQTNSPSMVNTLRELLDTVRCKYGNGYRLVLDPNIIDFWETVASAPKIRLWNKVAAYVIFFTISKYIGDVTIDLFLDSSELIARRDELINLAAFLISFPLTYVASRIFQRLLINKSDDIRSNINKLHNTIKFIRYDRKAQISFTIVSLTLVFAFLHSDFYFVSITIAYLIALYWLDRPIYILPLPIVALIFHVPVSAFSFQVLDEVFSLHIIHLLSLFLSFILLYAYIHTCKSMRFYYRPFAFSIATLICSLVLSNILNIDNLKMNPNYQLPSYRLTIFGDTKRKSRDLYLHNRQYESSRPNITGPFQEEMRPKPREIIRYKKPESDKYKKYFQVDEGVSSEILAERDSDTSYHNNIQNENHGFYNEIEKRRKEEEYYSSDKLLQKNKLINNNFRLNSDADTSFE